MIPLSKAENTAKDLACSEDAVFVCLTITVLPMSLPIKNKKLKKKKSQGILPGSHYRLAGPNTGQIQRLGPGYYARSLSDYRNSMQMW